MEYSDSERLDWLVEKLCVIRAGYLLWILGFTEDELTGPGHVTLRQLVTAAIDRRIEKEKL